MYFAEYLSCKTGNVRLLGKKRGILTETADVHERPTFPACSQHLSKPFIAYYELRCFFHSDLVTGLAGNPHEDNWEYIGAGEMFAKFPVVYCHFTGRVFSNRKPDMTRHLAGGRRWSRFHVSEWGCVNGWGVQFYIPSLLSFIVLRHHSPFHPCLISVPAGLTGSLGHCSEMKVVEEVMPRKRFLRDTRARERFPQFPR